MALQSDHLIGVMVAPLPALNCTRSGLSLGVLLGNLGNTTPTTKRSKWKLDMSARRLAQCKR